MSRRVVRDNKPDLVVRKNGKIEVDLNSISQDTIKEMEETARVLRKGERRKTK